MAVTERVWDSSDWTDRIGYLKDELGIETDADLATYIGVNSKSLYHWRRGTHIPRPDKEYMLKRLVVTGKSGREAEEKFVGANTVGFDAASEMFKNALAVGNSVTLSMAVHSICVKLAHTIAKTAGFPVVPYMSSIYGAFPAKENISIKVPGADGVECIVTVSHTESQPKMFVVMTELLYLGKLERQFMFAVNDQGISETCKRIVSYINLKYKTNV